MFGRSVVRNGSKDGRQMINGKHFRRSGAPDLCQPGENRRSFTHMFLFLLRSSRSMMKCCVWGGSTARLGIVLLSPHSQALGPAHAAAVRLLGGFPLRRRLLYRGFPVATDQSCWDASAAQPRVKRKHPFLLLPLFLLSSYLTAKNNTYSVCCIFASLLLMPYSLFCPFCCCTAPPTTTPPQKGDPNEYPPSVLCYLFSFFFVCLRVANYCSCLKQIASSLLFLFPL